MASYGTDHPRVTDPTLSRTDHPRVRDPKVPTIEMVSAATLSLQLSSGDAEAFAILVVQSTGSTFYRDGPSKKYGSDDSRRNIDSTSAVNRKMLPDHLRVDRIIDDSGKAEAARSPAGRSLQSRFSQA